MAALLTILGARDSRLEELVRASGLISTVTSVLDLSTLLDARAGQPDVLLCRRSSGTASSRQSGGTQAAASVDERDAARLRCRSGVDARRHARRGHRVHRRATESDATSMRRLRACSGSESRSRRRPRVRVRRRQGRSRNDDHGGQRCDGAGEARQGPDAARRPAPGLRGCGRVPRRRCAVLAAGRASRTCTGSTPSS